MSRGNQLDNMNLAVRGIDSQLAHEDTFHKASHERPRDSKRWRYAARPTGKDKVALEPDVVHHEAISPSTRLRTTRRFGVV